MFSWTSADGADQGSRMETARLVRSERGLRVNGYLVTVGVNAAGSWYSMMCDPAGQLRRLTVRADSVIGERSLSLTRAPGGPWVLDRADGKQIEPALAAVDDVVLGGSVLSHTLPIRRQAMHTGDEGSSQTIEVAVISIPDLTVSLEHITYTTSVKGQDGSAEISVTCNDVSTIVPVDAAGNIAIAANVRV